MRELLPMAKGRAEFMARLFGATPEDSDVIPYDPELRSQIIAQLPVGG